MRDVIEAIEAGVVGVVGEIAVHGGVLCPLSNIGGRILFTSYTGETATIDGSNTTAGTVLVNFYDANYVDFTNFEIVNSKEVGISLWASKNCSLKNNVVHNSLRSAIWVGAELTGQSYDNEVSGNRCYNNVMNNTAHTSVARRSASARAIASRY